MKNNNFRSEWTEEDTTMFALFLSTILTSAADSLNPIAITQQFVLQGMVRKPQHIWYFIISIALTNMASGYLAYYGLLSILGEFADQLIGALGKRLFGLELMIGVLFLLLCCWLVQNHRIQKLKQQLSVASAEGEAIPEEETAARKIKSVTPAALVVLGVAATISELTTALPYFAFLGILFQYHLSLTEVTILLTAYNIIYSLPLIILYFVYKRAREQFDRLYLWMKHQMSKLAGGVAPAAAGGIGCVLLFHSLWVLLK